MLVPAGFLVLLILASIAIDSASAYLARTQLQAALSGAANDALAAGLDRTSFYGGGSIRLEPALAAEAACQALMASDSSGFYDLSVRMWTGPDYVELRGQAYADVVVGRALGMIARRQVTASVGAFDASTPDRTGPAPTISGPGLSLDCTLG